MRPRLPSQVDAKDPGLFFKEVQGNAEGALANIYPSTNTTENGLSGWYPIAACGTLLYANWLQQ